MGDLERKAAEWVSKGFLVFLAVVGTVGVSLVIAQDSWIAGLIYFVISGWIVWMISLDIRGGRL